MANSSIYLIKCTEDSNYKIGVSKNPTERLRTHQTSNPFQLKLVGIYETERAFQIEKILHRRYSYAKKEGEWFDLSIKEEIEFVRECNRIDESLNDLARSGNVFI